jgi:hypothetical protein
LLLGKLGTPCHSVWVGDGHEREVIERVRVCHRPIEKQWVYCLRAQAVMGLVVGSSSLCGKK